MSKIVTLQDMVKETHNGLQMEIADLMTQENEILQDAHWEESTDFDSHTFAIETYIPLGGWRHFNQGVPADAGKTAQGKAYMGEHENPIVVDTRLLKKAPDKEKFFNRRVARHSEGSSQFLAKNIFYGNHGTDPAAFTGIAPNLDSLSHAYVYGCGGTADGAMTSIYGLDWGPEKCYMAKPRGAKSPIEITDRQFDYKTDEFGNDYKVIRCEIIFSATFVVQDPKAAFRLCNLDPTKFADAEATAGAFKENLLIQALNKSKSRGKTMKLYCNDDVLTMADIRIKDKANMTFTTQELFGVDVPGFKKRPLRFCEAILSTEGQVS